MDGVVSEEGSAELDDEERCTSVSSVSFKGEDVSSGEVSTFLVSGIVALDLEFPVPLEVDEPVPDIVVDEEVWESDAVIVEDGWCDE